MVPRARLIERLAQGTERKLTLVSAPPGSGKTTMLAEWLADSPADERAAAWVSLDQGDNDPLLFWAYFIAALQTVQSGVGENALSLLHSRQPPPIEALLGTLLNEISAISHDFVLVLDDYHLIDRKPIHEGMTFLLDHLAPQMRLVIASRADPPLPLSRLRGRGELAELRASDLRFTPGEAAAFLNDVMGLGLSADDVAALETRTEGWIAGLHLAGLSMQGREDLAGFIETFNGTHRYLLDYLGEEVLQRQAGHVQSFLMQTSILGRLTGPLCDAVTAQADGQAMLEQFERANLFTTALDDERRWYRYHHLFAEFLVRRLSQQEVSQVADLHRRASGWYEANDLWHEAIGHALAASDFDTAARIILHAADTIGMAAETNTFLGWLNSFPDEQFSARPQLCIYHSVALSNNLQYDAAERRLQEAETAISEMEESSAKTQDMLGRVAVLRSGQALGPVGEPDIPRSIELSKQALEQLPLDSLWRGDAAQNLGACHLMNGDSKAAAAAYQEAISISDKAGDTYGVLTAISGLAAVQVTQAMFREAHKTIQQGLQIAAEQGMEKLPVVCRLHTDMGSLLHQWNELDAATQHLSASIELGREYGNDWLLIYAYANLALVKQSQGDLDAALDLIDQAIQMFDRKTPAQDIPTYLLYYQVELWVARGMVEAAALWAEGSGLRVDDDPTMERVYDYLALARVLIAQGRLDNAMELLERLLSMAEGVGRPDIIAQVLTLQAIALQAKGNGPRAAGMLERALALAEPAGVIRFFVDKGEPIAALLSRILGAQERELRPESHKISRAYLRKLLAAFEETPVSDASTALERAQLQLVEPLTSRELEVLQLIAAGLSNRKIAEELIVSVGTVKAHAHNIYGKLDVRSRAQAIARARDLNLLN